MDCLDEYQNFKLLCAPQILRSLIDNLFLLSATLAVVIVMIAGIRFITSSGEATKVAGAKRTFYFALIGLAVIVLSFVFLNFLSFVTGSECIKKLGFDC